MYPVHAVAEQQACTDICRCHFRVSLCYAAVDVAVTAYWYPQVGGPIRLVSLRIGMRNPEHAESYSVDRSRNRLHRDASTCQSISVNSSQK